MILLITLSLMVLATFIEFKLPYSGWHKNLKIAFRVLVILPLIVFIITQPILGAYSILLITSLIFCIVSDILLLYNFNFGSYGFILVHLINLLNFVLNIKNFNSGTIVYLVLLVLGSIYFYFQTLKSKDYKILLYLVLLITTFWISSFVGLICSIGYLLFVLCDVEVIYVEYVKEFKWCQQINHLLYYSGLILLTLSAVIKF